MLNAIRPYAKAVVAYGGALVATATILLSAQHVDVAQIVQIVVAWLTAFGVHQVPNTTPVQ